MATDRPPCATGTNTPRPEGGAVFRVTLPTIRVKEDSDAG